jgi:Family of unknown function (DUF5947)
VSEGLDQRLAARRRADLVAGLRRRAAPRAGAPANGNGGPARPREERCELCGARVPDDHRHLLHLAERRIVCTCEACWAMRSGVAEYRPVGTRTLWLEGFEMSDDVWARLAIPIGLAFFMRSTTTEGVVALYPSPVGATESELALEAWRDLEEANPVLERLDADIEALIVNRMSDPAQYAIAPIDRAYELVGRIKLAWDGISGGPGVDEAVGAFFAGLRERAAA